MQMDFYLFKCMYSSQLPVGVGGALEQGCGSGKGTFGYLLSKHRASGFSLAGDAWGHWPRSGRLDCVLTRQVLPAQGGQWHQVRSKAPGK